MNANDPAFPNSHDHPTFTARGLTKRQHVAVLMMAALLNNDPMREFKQVARFAVIATDDLLAELDRTEQK